jgi:hypothetical protein
VANGKGPLAKFEAAGVCVATWENSASITGEQRTLLKASIKRRYKDPKDGSWESSTSFSRNELPVLQYLLSRAYGAMLQERAVGADVVEEGLVE